MNQPDEPNGEFESDSERPSQSPDDAFVVAESNIALPQPTPSLPAEIKTSWLHPTSLFFDLISHFRELIVPIVIAIFSAASGSLTGLFFAMAFFVPAVMFSVFRYFTLRYKIDHGEMVVKQGLIFRRVRTVPINRIQNIDLMQTVLHRLFRVAEVRIETASGTEPEAVLRVLSMQKVAQLRQQIFANDRPAPITSPDNAAAESTESVISESVISESVISESVISDRADSGVTLLQIPASWLVKAGVASNRGLVLIGILYGAWYQFDLEDKIDLDRVRKALPSPDGSIVSTLQIIGLAIVVLLLLRVFSVVWFLLRFYGYRLALHGEDMRITCGMFTKISATVPRNRIQFISIHRPLFLRWMGLASIRIETAGGGGMSGQDSTVSRRWFVPVLRESGIRELVEHLRPGLAWDEETLDWKSLAPKAGKRLMRLGVIQSVGVTVIGVAVTRPWGWLAGIPALPLLLWWARKKSRAMRYVRSNQFVVYRSGVLNRKTSLTFWDKVQTVSIRQSPFDRRWRMATLAVDTAASGPAEHNVRIRYLDQAFANDEYREISAISAQYQPDFG